jgi:hypothetical protein
MTWANGCRHGGIGGQVDDPLVLVRQAHLALGAQHAVRLDAADGGGLEVEAGAGDAGAGRGEHALHAGAGIGRAAHDLDRSVPVSTTHTLSLSALGCCLGGHHIGDREGREIAGGVDHLLDLEADHGERVGDLVDGGVGVEMVLQPGQGELHRLSPPCSARHVERPEAVVAQPAQVGIEEGAQVGDAVFQHGDAVDAHAEGEALIDVGIDADIAQDFGWTMPQPRISSQSSPSPMRISLPSRAQPTSTSIDGSVKGKWLGRKRILTSSTSKNALQNSSRHHFRWPRWVCSSITRPSTWWNMGVWVWSESQR